MKRDGAKTKLRKFFVEHIGEVINSSTLQRVADSSEWARRVRELRNEDGLNIITHNDDSSLKPANTNLST